MGEFYFDNYGLSLSIIGSTFIIIRLIDAFSDPIMGYIADNTSTRWGKFRPYILFGSVPALIMIILCFTSPDLSQTGKFYWALFTYITFTTLYTIIAIPVGSLIPAMTQDRDERTSLASFRYLGASSGSIAVAVLTLPLVGLFSSPQIGFPIVVGCLAVLGAIFAFLCFFNTKEVYSKPYEETIGIKKVTKMVFNNYPLHFVILALLTTWVANNIKQLTVVYFVKYNLQLEAYFSPILLGVILQIMFGAYLVNLIKHRFEKKTLFMIGTFLYVITDLIIYYITGYENFWLLAFIATFGFIGFGMAGVMAWSMIADTIEYGEWKSGFRAEGVLNAAHVFVFKLSVGFSAWLAGVILESTDYVANAIDQSPETLNGLFIMGYIFPAVAGTIAIIVTYFNKYDSNFYERIFSELKQRQS